MLVHHDAPCFGVRDHAADVLLAYTGDTGPCAGLTELVSDADLLISEAGYGLGEGDVDPVHLTAAQAEPLPATDMWDSCCSLTWRARTSRPACALPRRTTRARCSARPAWL